MSNVATAEKELEENVSNKTVKNMMDQYQKAIEYYSAIDNKCYEDILNRMTGLFKREDVQKALAQPDEEAKAEETPEDSAKSEPAQKDTISNNDSSDDKNKQ
jgi:hypothetical protein